MGQSGLMELLAEEERAWLARLGEIAQAAGARAWLVGGPVRDLLLGCRCPDTDLAIEGDVPAVAAAIAAELGGRVRKTTEFMTASVALDRGDEIDIAHARTERYEAPGALPTVAAAGLRDDLARRDFTVNAMALALTPGEFDELVDPHGGRTDLQARLLRVLHERSFEDDPTRMLRAVRFMHGLGLRLEEHTAELLRRAADRRRLEPISGARLRNELRRICATHPAHALGELQALGLLTAMGLPDAPEQAVARSRELPAAVEALGLGGGDLQPLAAILALYSAGAGISPARLSVRLMLAAPERSALSAAAGLLTRPPDALAGGPDSALYFALEGAPATVVAVLWAALDDTGRERVERYWCRLRRVKPDVTGVDLIAAGHRPGPEFGPALRRALAAKLDRGAGRDEQMRVVLAAFSGDGR